MPIRVQNDLPVKEILESENIFVMDEHRAMHQDIRPIKIGLLNLMPLKGGDRAADPAVSVQHTASGGCNVCSWYPGHESKNTSDQPFNTSFINRFE